MKKIRLSIFPAASFPSAIALMMMVSLFLFTLTDSTLAYTPPQTIARGAAAIALGGLSSFSGVANFTNNPAAVGQDGKIDLASMYGKMLDDSSFYNLSVGGEWLEAKFFLAWSGNMLDNIIYATGVDSDGRPNGYATTSAGSSEIGLGISQDLGQIDLLGFLGDISLGGRFNYYTTNISGVDGGSGKGFGIDLGATARPLPNLTLAIYQQNLPPASFWGNIGWDSGRKEGLKKTTDLEAYYEVIPRALMAGAGYSLNWNRALPGRAHLGAQWKPAEIIALRAGLEQDVVSNGVVNNLTAGLGLSWQDFTFDYAFRQYQQAGDSPSHYFSLGYGFDAGWAGATQNTASATKPTLVSQESEITVISSTNYEENSSVLPAAPDMAPVTAPALAPVTAPATVPIQATAKAGPPILKSGKKLYFRVDPAGVTYNKVLVRMPQKQKEFPLYYSTSQAAWLGTSQAALPKGVYQAEIRLVDDSGSSVILTNSFQVN